jgi:putative membrane protein
VREIAQRMTEDHARLGEQMRRTVEAADQTEALPDTLDERRQGMIDNLRTAPAEEFDRRCLQQQTVAHQEAIALFEGYGENGDVPQLKRLAQEAVPTLKAHLQAVRSAQGR